MTDQLHQEPTPAAEIYRVQPAPGETRELFRQRRTGQGQLRRCRESRNSPGSGGPFGSAQSCRSALADRRSPEPAASRRPRPISRVETRCQRRPPSAPSSCCSCSSPCGRYAPYGPDRTRCLRPHPNTRSSLQLEATIDNFLSITGRKRLEPAGHLRIGRCPWLSRTQPAANPVRRPTVPVRDRPSSEVACSAAAASPAAAASKLRPGNLFEAVQQNRPRARPRSPIRACVA